MPSARGLRAQSAMPSPSRLGINAVIDSTQQIVHFSRANLRFRIIERDGAAKTALWKLQPDPRLFDVAKNVRGMLEQSQKAHHLVRLIGRQSPSGFTALQSGP